MSVLPPIETKRLYKTPIENVWEHITDQKKLALWTKVDSPYGALPCPLLVLRRLRLASGYGKNVSKKKLVLLARTVRGFYDIQYLFIHINIVFIHVCRFEY